jgi:hypothetical protein
LNKPKLREKKRGKDDDEEEGGVGRVVLGVKFNKQTGDKKETEV